MYFQPDDKGRYQGLCSGNLLYASFSVGKCKTKVCKEDSGKSGNFRTVVYRWANKLKLSNAQVIIKTIDLIHSYFITCKYNDESPINFQRHVTILKVKRLTQKSIIYARKKNHPIGKHS